MMSRASSRPDGEWGWMCVMGKLCSFFCVLGTSSAFGIIYVDIIDYFNTTREKAAWIGSMCFGLTSFSGPFSNALTSRFGIQKTTAAGTLLVFSGCFISWFASGIPYLYISYGLMMGWLNDKTKNYNASFYVVAGSFFLSMLVMILHRRQNRQETGEVVVISVQKVSQSHMNTCQIMPDISNMENNESEETYI